MSSRAILPSALVAFAFLMLPACGDEETKGKNSGFLTGGTAKIDRVDSLPDAEGKPYSGLIAKVGQSVVRDVDVNRPIDIHLYAKAPATGFGPRHWIFEGTKTTALKLVQVEGRPADESQDKGRVRLTMPSKAEMSVELQGPETEVVEIYYSQGDEMAYCIGTRLSVRRCRETEGTDCDQKLASWMKGHSDSCANVDGLK